MRDPRYKHEYLDKLTKIFKRQDDDGDESDTHVEARDRRYSCLKLQQSVSKDDRGIDVQTDSSQNNKEF